jgi:transcriptional regulator with XRE-family HTH domain
MKFENFPPKKEGVGFIKQEEIMFFGSFLRKARAILGKTPKKIAEELGLNVGSVENWEKGMAFPKPEIFVEVAKVYNVPLEDLISHWEISKNARQIEVKVKHIPTSRSRGPLEPIGKNGKTRSPGINPVDYKSAN